MSVGVEMHRQDCDLQLTRYDESGWRATFYTTGVDPPVPRARGARATLAIAAVQFTAMLMLLIEGRERVVERYALTSNMRSRIGVH